MIDLDMLLKASRKPWYCRSEAEENMLSPEFIAGASARIEQAEKDAARYRWIKENSQLGVGKFGFDWELHFEGVAPDNHSLIESHIDEAMNGSNN